MDDPLLHERDERGPDLHPEIPPRDHHRVGLGQDVVEDVDRLGLLDLRDHVRVRAGLLDQRLQIPDVGGRPHERQRDAVHAQLERELEVFQVLARERRDRDRDSGEVHALVRADEAADEDAAARASRLDLFDAQPNETVVDQHLVAGVQNLADRGGSDGKLAVAGAAAVADDHDLVSARKRQR